MKELTKDIIYMTIIAGATAPLIPWARRLGVNMSIAIGNRLKGKPKYVVGTRFKTLMSPSGHVYGECFIERTDFEFVYVRVVGGGLLPIKKIDLRKFQPEIMDDDTDCSTDVKDRDIH